MAKQFNIGCGMINRRRNCFFNSTMQALFQIPTIAKCLKTDQNDGAKKCKIRGCMTCTVIDLFGNTQSSNVPCNPYQLYGTLKKANLRFSNLLNGEHQDAHEFLVLLNEELEKQVHSALWFANNFTFELTTHIQCGSCGKINESFGTVTDVALHIVGNRTIQAALDSYFDHDDIEYMCEACKTDDTVQKKYFILSAPACLCLQLRRFSDRGTKITDAIEISSKLSIAKHLLKTQLSQWNYKLVSIVNHFGEYRNVGHYNTIVLTPNGDHYEFDDSTVRQVSSSLVSGKDAYMLFYEREESRNDDLGIEKPSPNEDSSSIEIGDCNEILLNPVKIPTENVEVLLECNSVLENEQLPESSPQNSFQFSDQHNRQLSGRRIVDMDYVFKQMNQITEFDCTICKSGKLIFSKEIRKGILSSFIFICNNCVRQVRINSCPTYHDTENIKLSAVLGITAVGLGYYHLQEFLGHLDVPVMSYVTYHKYEQEKVQVEYFKLCKKLEAEALDEEIRLAKEMNVVDSAGNALIDVEFDGSWEKRAYTGNFSSLSGCAAIIGLKTKKLLFSAIRTKYCHICKIAKSRDTTPRKHNCRRNYDGPSSGMETEIIIEGFKYCATKGARFYRYVGDGDSSTYKALRDLQLYKDPYIAIEKFECVNHLFRNFLKQFKALLTASKLNVKGRKLLTLELGRNICKGIRLAAQHWRKSNVELSEKYFNLERNVMNAFLHYVGIHDHCGEYFCTKITNPEALNMITVLKGTGVYYEVLDLCQKYFGSNVKSLVAGLCTNKTEGFNSLIAKSLAGKRICNSLAGSYQLRTNIASVQYNTGGHSGSTIQEFIFNKSTPICKKIENTRKRKCENNAIAIEKNPKTYPADEPPNKKKKKKKLYGDGHEDLDMTESQYEVAKIRFLQRLVENQLNRINIQIDTRSQRHSFQWTEVRRLMLTTSYFGRILNVRSRRSYANIVEDILYKNIQYGNTAEIRHQRNYEVEGLSIFSELYPHESIYTCGIFIDETFSFLACVQKSMKDSIRTISFWSGTHSNRNINKKSHWFFEIQGQLHIANKQIAYLVIYLGGQEYEIVEIERNDAFWKLEMEKELCYFYNEALLKELINPREERGMELRQYNSKKETFE